MNKFYLTASLLITGIVTFAGIAAWGGDGPASKWHLIASILCFVGAMGVILLSLSWLKLCGEITSIAGYVNKQQGNSGKIKNLAQIADEISAFSKSKNDCIDRLQNQINELKLQVKLSQRQKRNTEAIIFGIRDAVIVTDEYDNLLMANESAEQLFNFNSANSLRKPLLQIIDSQKKEFANLLGQIKLNGLQHTRREFKFTVNSKPCIFDCIFSCVYEDNRQQNSERPCGAVAVLHDITREKEISQMKDDFVSYVSHELRTPLASITAYSEMLMDGEVTDEQSQKEFYSVIQNQAKRLNRLIEDILNTARIESGLIKIKKEPLSLTMLMREQMQMMKTYASEKNISLSWAADCQEPIICDQVVADKDMMSQVIVNLLSNAVKYTPSGGSVKVNTEIDEISSLVRVTVTDTGVGIPEDDLENLFKKFYRVEANKKQAPGTGLGLSLVKQIIEKIHNGRIFVKSKVGQGSTFGFELPLASMQTANV